METPPDAPTKWTDLARAQIDLLRVAEGFFDSRVLFALQNLGVFQVLRTDALSPETIAAQTGTRPDALIRLLRAGVALRLLESDETGTFRIAQRWRPLLADAARDTYQGNWLGFLDYLDGALGHLEAAARGDEVPLLLESSRPPDLREFALAMHNYAAVRGSEITQYLDTTACSKLLDVGCGPGTYAFQLGLRNPGLELYLVDAPDILQVAAQVQQRYPLRNTIHYVPLDLEHEDVQGTYDLVLVSNTLHMLGEQASRRLLGRLWRVVAPGGSLVVQAQFLDDDRKGGRWPVFLDLAQLCVTRHGRNHTVAETRTWLEDAGFHRIEFCAMSAFNTNAFLRAYRPVEENASSPSALHREQTSTERPHG